MVICSSSGWAHGARTDGRKVVYCHNPARWLYQRSDYLGDHPSVISRLALGTASAYLTKWDRRAARSAHRYLANSSVVRRRIQIAYGVDAEVLPPPASLSPEQPREAVAGLHEGFFLCVGRLRPYKNVGSTIGAFATLPDEQLVVVGSGPDQEALRRSVSTNVHLVGEVSDDQLRWLYANCRAVVSAAREDFGLTPIEAAVFGRPSVTLRWGGFLDTVVEGETGMFFDQPEPGLIACAIKELIALDPSPSTVRDHGALYDERRFMARLQEVVAEEAGL